MSYKQLAIQNEDAELLQLFSHESVSCAAPMPQDELLPTIASILSELCEANDQSPSPVISKFHAARNPGISIIDYLRRVCQYADCSNTCFVLALIYIDRVQAHPNFQVCTLNVHRLIITSVMLAAKFFDDHYFNNAFYARIGGVSKEEMNQLELEYLFMVGFTLTVTEREYMAYDTELRAHCHRLAERRLALERQQQEQERLLEEQRRQAEIQHQLQVQAQQQQYLYQQQQNQQQQHQQHQHQQHDAFGHPHQHQHQHQAAPWSDGQGASAAAPVANHWKASGAPTPGNPGAAAGDEFMSGASCSPTTGFARSSQSGSYNGNLVAA